MDTNLHREHWAHALSLLNAPTDLVIKPRALCAILSAVLTMVRKHQNTNPFLDASIAVINIAKEASSLQAAIYFYNTALCMIIRKYGCCTLPPPDVLIEIMNLAEEASGTTSFRVAYRSVSTLLTMTGDPTAGAKSRIKRRINDMDKRLEDHAISGQERLKLFNELCKTCSRRRMLPESMHIPDCSNDSVEVGCGGSADVSQSTYKGRRVAVKVVHVNVSNLDVVFSRFCREGVAWKHLRHPNILPLLGVTVSEHRFAMVSGWMENGNINEFVKRDRHANRTELMAGVAGGLKYMHDLQIVHGDLKGANILINKDRRACIADFGLTTITGVAPRAGASRESLISNDTLMSFTGGGTHRWMSPELLDPERFGMPQSEDRPTKQSDCYALGMAIYEVLCGHHPYLEISSDFLVINAITEGVRPAKPEGAKRLGFSNELWRTIGLCWLEDRDARPSVEDILSCLNDAAAFWYMREF